MSLLYTSTRSTDVKVTASQAILKGLAADGGLFVPEALPAMDISLEELAKMDYKQVAYEVMKLFITDFTEEELKNCINKAYDSNSYALFYFENFFSSFYIFFIGFSNIL